MSADPPSEGAKDGDDGRDQSYLTDPFLDPANMAWLYKPLPKPKPQWPRERYREPKITEADRHAWSEWEARGFTSVERDVWIEAGLGRFDYVIATLCRDAGLTPDDLRRKVDGQLVVQLLRSSSWSPAAMSAYLRTETA